MVYYSTTPRYDGFGAQLQNVIWDILFIKELFEHDYVITIPEKMEHNYDNKVGYIEELFDFMNLKKLFKMRHEVMEEVEYLGYISTYRRVEDNFKELLHSNTMNKLREAFFEDKVSPYDSNFFNIAIHIRHSNTHDHYGVPVTDEEYAKVLQRLREEYPGENVLFHTYSQGPLENFSFLKGPRVVFHLDEPIQQTFLGFVFADVLCITKSSFSYLAAHYNKNKIYAFSFHHTLDDTWTIVG